MRRFFLSFFILSSVHLSAQEYNGTTGLMHIPTAETDSAGTFRGGGMFINKRFTPNQLIRNGAKYNTFTYYIGITVWSWLELSYAAALLKMNKSYDPNEPMGYYNEDRRVNVKLRPLKEGRWWPAIAIGCDDVGRFERIKTQQLGNNYFQNFYIAGSKHLDLKGNELGIHLLYRYYSQDMNRTRRGIAGGVSFRPQFYRDLRLMAEWDGECVNVGADVLLWRHLYIQAGLTNAKYIVGGVSYHYRIPF